MKVSKNLILLGKEIIRRYKAHHITAFSGQMAYFFILSLFPFLIFLMSLTSIFPIDIEWMENRMGHILPSEASGIILDYVKTLTQSSHSLLSISALFTLWSSSRAVIAIMRALNVVYEVKETRGFFKVKLYSMLYTVMFAVAIIAALVLPSMGTSFFSTIRRFIDISQPFIELFTSMRWIGMLVFTIVVIGSAHVVMPNKKIAFRQALPGAVFSMAGWWVLSYGFSFFVQNFGRFTVIYGSLTAVILMMMWLYISGFIFILGGEINHYLMERSERI